MPIKDLGLLRHAIVCDDPYHRKCTNESEHHFGEEHTINLALKAGWYRSESTGQFSCPRCLQLHNKVLEKKIKNRTIAKGSSRRNPRWYHHVHADQVWLDYYSDPFEAYWVTELLGGDPDVAAEYAAITGDTDFGIIIGLLAGEEERTEAQFQGGGGDAGGAGASATFDDQSNVTPVQDQYDQTQYQSDQASQIDNSVSSEPQPSLPLIVDPFEDDRRRVSEEAASAWVSTSDAVPNQSDPVSDNSNQSQTPSNNDVASDPVVSSDNPDPVETSNTAY